MSETLPTVCLMNSLIPCKHRRAKKIIRDSSEGFHLGMGEHENPVDASSHPSFSGLFRYVRSLVRNSRSCGWFDKLIPLYEKGKTPLCPVRTRSISLGEHGGFVFTNPSP